MRFNITFLLQPPGANWTERSFSRLSITFQVVITENYERCVQSNLSKQDTKIKSEHHRKAMNTLKLSFQAFIDSVQQ